LASPEFRSGSPASENDVSGFHCQSLQQDRSEVDSIEDSRILANSEVPLHVLPIASVLPEHLNLPSVAVDSSRLSFFQNLVHNEEHACAYPCNSYSPSKTIPYPLSPLLPNVASRLDSQPPRQRTVLVVNAPRCCMIHHKPLFSLRPPLTFSIPILY